MFSEIIEEDLMRMINESRTTGKVLVAFNTTSIALIPKFNNPDSFDLYRPVSLCNCVYKIIGKANAMRVKRWLLVLISTKQFGFLLEGQIHEVVGVA